MMSHSFYLNWYELAERGLRTSSLWTDSLCLVVGSGRGMR